MANLKHLERFYDKYHKTGNIQTRIIGNNNFTYRGAIEIYKKILFYKDKLNILDYGCGVGTISLFLSSQGNKVTGIDVSQRAIDLAKENSNSTGQVSLTNFQTLNSWNQRDHKKSFDLVVSLEVIEHVSNDDKLLFSFHSYLKNKGTLLLSTPTLNAPLYRLGLLDKFDKEVGHLRRYDIGELVKKIEQVGFKVILVKKNEGIIRNSLYVFPKLGFLIRFIKGPISDIITLLDRLSIPFFGESNVYIVATKK